MSVHSILPGGFQTGIGDFHVAEMASVKKIWQSLPQEIKDDYGGGEDLPANRTFDV